MVEFICDGCGKREPGYIGAGGSVFKPSEWYGRQDEDGQQHACCRACVKIIAEKSGKTAVVLPI